MPSPLPVRPVASHSHATMERLRHRWGWFVALGGVAVCFGLVALVLVISATLAAVYTIAVFMIIAGGSEIIVGLGSKTWTRAFLWTIAGIFYIVAGAFALAQPGHAAVILTLLLGVSLAATGITRIYIGSHLHTHARTMVILGGVVTLLVGLLVIMGWPNNSIVILGTLLGVDLLFTGVTWIGFGLRLRSHA